MQRIYIYLKNTRTTRHVSTANDRPVAESRCNLWGQSRCIFSREPNSSGKKGGRRLVAKICTVIFQSRDCSVYDAGEVSARALRPVVAICRGAAPRKREIPKGKSS